jgi:hypothetical protein
MKPVDSIKLLNQLEGRVEIHLQQVVSRLQNLPDNILLRIAPDGGWSIAQCLDHLNGYGDHYLSEIKKAIDLSEMPAASKFKSSWLGNYFTKMMDPDSGKKKFKTFKNHVPRRNLDPSAVVVEFILQQELLVKYLRLSHTRDLNSTKIPISISQWIKLKLGDVFQFIIAHNERHLRQAFRNLPKEVESQR